MTLKKRFEETRPPAAAVSGPLTPFRRWPVFSLTLGLLALLCALGLWMSRWLRPVRRDLGERTFVSFVPAQVVVEHPVGRLSVRAGSPGEVRVAAVAEAKGLTPAEAQALLQQAQVRLQPSADGRLLRIIAEAPAPPTGSLSLHLTLTVPPEVTLEVHHEVGAVRFTGLDAVVHLRQGVGEVRWEDGRLGAGSSWQIATGSVTFRGRLPTHGTVTLGVDVGTLVVTLPSEPAVHLEAAVDTGSLTIQGGEHEVRTHEAFQADFGDHPKTQLRLRVTTGSIRIRTR